MAANQDKGGSYKLTIAPCCYRNLSRGVYFKPLTGKTRHPHSSAHLILSRYLHITGEFNWMIGHRIGAFLNLDEFQGELAESTWSITDQPHGASPEFGLCGRH